VWWQSNDGGIEMLFVSLRDLQWRRRRFIIGVLATGLVFALALLITGMSSSFQNEVTRSVEAFDVDRWLVPEGSSGPFTSATIFGAALVDEVRAQPGVDDAAPIAVLRDTVDLDGLVDINVIAVEPGGIGVPEVDSGVPLSGTGVVVADKSLDVDVGDTLNVFGEDFEVVGQTEGVTYYAGTPTVFVPLEDAQRLALGAQPLATAIVANGDPEAVGGMRVLTNAEVEDDLRRPLNNAVSTIDFLRILLWVVAAGIIGSVVYLQAMERTRDFAVLKATGSTNRTLVFGLAVQAVLLAVAAAIAAVGLAALLSPTMDMNIEIPSSAYVILPIVAIVVGLLSSLAGLRRAVSVDPALAFGG
jgi:putative ABC transport system permease protein